MCHMLHFGSQAAHHLALAAFSLLATAFLFGALVGSFILWLPTALLFAAAGGIFDDRARPTP
jgi:hypothetical protein